ncbi:MAG: ABC transporter ATP-binding protein [Bacteroidota bacterium]
MSNLAILVEDLVKVYEERTDHPVRALDGLSLVVRQGEIFGLLGRNGAGKTTLLRILTTLSRPTAGTVTVLGLDVVQQSYAVRRQLCAVLQENAVEIFLSVEDNLSTYARFHSIPRREIGARAGAVMEQFGLREYRTQKVIDLSGGLKRRLQVAKVFMVDKPLVFLDEATTGMDPINRRTTLDAIREQARKGRTIFLTTHMLEEAEELCDTIAIIDKGKRLAVGDPRTVKSFGSRVVDIRVTYAPPGPASVARLSPFPLMRLEHRNTTIDVALDADRISPFEVLQELGRLGTVVNLEVTEGSLEDAFFELLGSKGDTPAPWRDRP